MASSSASSAQKIFRYAVFFSFKGEDTRKNFVDHLYHALVNRGIITYKDDETIEKGERIDGQLIRSIEESRFSIIVFSKNYASSSWCLNQLVEIMKCHKTTEHTAYPVFYDVEPTEVRNQTGAFGEAFAKLVAKHEKEEAAGIWRKALKEAADLAGWELKNTLDGHELKFIQKIVEEISLELHFNEKLVGMETRVQELVSSLEIGVDDVRMIGIKGMGGSGKTTLARTVFDHISHLFEGKSFVENVREVSKGSFSGLKELQKQVLKDVFDDKDIVVMSVLEGKYMMKKMMRSRKVLIVLDDVDDIEQLEAIAGEPAWFKPGSRIIITTRDEQVLIAHLVKFIYDVNLLSDEEAFCLFNRYAFGRETPVQEFENLSLKVVQYAAGLPLTIKVLGSFLCGKDMHEWEDALDRLKKIPLKGTLRELELSYNGLEDDQKHIFLDVACILKGERKDEVIRILESCGFNAVFGLRVLEQKGLITISDAGRLFLHDLVEEMGKNIVRRLHPDEPYKHSRLWIKEEIEDILVNDLGTEATRSIKLEGSDLHPAIFMKGLRKMTKLRFLCLDGGFRKFKIDEDAQFLPNTLQYLHWPQYPFWYLPETFQANMLVNLEMIGSNISQIWGGGKRKVLNKLRFLNLSCSQLRTFDLGMTPNLERLHLAECETFVELYMPVECPKLKFLNLCGSKLSNLNLGLTPNLSWLDLRGCNDLVELHMPIELPYLKFLSLSGSKLSNVNLGLSLHLNKLESLEKLTLSIKDIKQLPDSIYTLKHLKYLELKSCWLLEQLPKELDRLELLEELYVTDCAALRDIPNSICKLKYLEYLRLPYCILLEKLPKELGRIKGLKELNIEGTGIDSLPRSILQLKGLHIIGSKWQLESYGLTSVKEISNYTASCYI